MITSIKPKLARLLEALDRSFVERASHIRLTLLAILTGHHVLLLGPPGTAKSMLARASCACVRDASFFEYLLSKFTHPDELFGPVSIPGLKDEDYRRLTESYLPRAHVAFLDEIFKANSAILNSLLTLINERVFHHGKHRDPVPLLGLVAASNEPPDPEGGLSALYDRFLVRLPVPPIGDDDHFIRVSLGDIPPFQPNPDHQLTAAEVEWLRGEARSVTADATVRRALLQIRAALAEAQIDASDRRWRWAVELLKMSALTSGRSRISMIDVALLEHCFGDPASSQATARKIVRDALALPIERSAYLGPLEEQWQSYPKTPIVGELAAWKRQIRKDLDAFRSLCDQTQAQIDAQVRIIEADVASTPWCTETPSELMAGFVSTRAAILGYQSVAAKHRSTVGDFDPAAALQAWHAATASHNNWGYHQHATFSVAFKARNAAQPIFGISHHGVPISSRSQEGGIHLEIAPEMAHLIIHPFASGPIARDLSVALAEAVNRARLSAAANKKQQAKSRRLYQGVWYLDNEPLEHGHGVAPGPIPNDHYKDAIEAWIKRIRADASVRPPDYPPLEVTAPPEAKRAKQR